LFLPAHQNYATAPTRPHQALQSRVSQLSGVFFRFDKAIPSLEMRPLVSDDALHQAAKNTVRPEILR
jgi:hypothetical protein